MNSSAASSTMFPIMSQLRPLVLSFRDHNCCCPLFLRSLRRPKKMMKQYSTVSPVMRLFGAATFEASKLKVVVLGMEDRKMEGGGGGLLPLPIPIPRAYTLTHNDITAMLTLPISQSINNSQLQGWSNKLYRDEVVGEWKKVKGKMSLHVHCHISGGHFLLDLCAPLRYSIFCNELPVVLKAFVHGDEKFINGYPELQEALVWIHFHSSIPQFDKVECWGPLREAAGGVGPHRHLYLKNYHHLRQVGDQLPRPCLDESCKCCSPPMRFVPSWSRNHPKDHKPHRNKQ